MVESVGGSLGWGVEVGIGELLLEISSIISLLSPSKQESGKPPRAKLISSRLHGESSRTT